MRDFAGAVIGRGGEHVTDIRKESGALVHVCKPDFETGKIQNTPCSQASPLFLLCQHRYRGGVIVCDTQQHPCAQFIVVDGPLKHCHPEGTW